MTKSPENAKTWGEMTNAEKGALLLADHNGEEMECHVSGDVWESKWNGTRYYDCDAYRVKPKPVIETVTVKGSEYAASGWVFDECDRGRYAITFDTIDGEPDCASVKMEPIND